MSFYGFQEKCCDVKVVLISLITKFSLEKKIIEYTKIIQENLYLEGIRPLKYL